MRYHALLFRTWILIAVAALAAPAAAAPPEAPPPQIQPRPLSATVRIEPADLVEGGAARFRCLLRNTSAVPVAVLGLELCSNVPGLSRAWTFTRGPVRADGVGRDGDLLRLARHRGANGHLEGASDAGLWELRQVIAPGAALQVGLSAQAIPPTDGLLDATLRVRWVAADALPLAWGPLSQAPADGPAQVVQQVRRLAGPQALGPGALVPASGLSAARTSDYQILAPVASGGASLKAALQRAGLAPGDLLDAAWLPEARTWALESRKIERTWLVVDGEVFQFPGRLAAWFRDIALGEGPSELSLSGPDGPEVARILEGLPSVASPGGRTWRVPPSRLPRLILQLQGAGRLVTPPARVEQP